MNKIKSIDDIKDLIARLYQQGDEYLEYRAYGEE